MKKKLLKIVSNITVTLFMIGIGLIAFVVLSSRISGGEPALNGHQFKAVLSGSMEPTFQTGSVIAIKLSDNQSSYKKGDVITFRMEEKLITHRITEVLEQNGQAAFKTKGDNNDSEDPWTVYPHHVVGKYYGFSIPYAGYALNFASSKTGSALLLIVPGVLLLISAISTIIGAKREIESSQA